MEISVETEFEDPNFIYSQKADNIQKKLVYNYKRCVGCGICVDICPSIALELGPIPEIATGLDAPSVMLDQDACSFCGMCAAFCPVGAMEMFLDGMDFLELEDYPHYDSKISVNDNCLPCVLCEHVCPQKAIELTLNIPKKEEISPLKEGIEGSIKVDMEKCNFCGICARFCEAFILSEAEFTSENLKPFEDLLIDENKCDYCKICVDLCPEDAISCKSEEIVKEIPKIDGKIDIDDEKCIKCGSCKKICPYDAIELIKPLEGEVKIIERNLYRCDPQGCQACIKICPSKAWYIPKLKDDEKIAVNDSICIFCGACSNSCAYDVISVKRDKVSHTPLKDASWKEEWLKAISQIESGPSAKIDLSRILRTKEPPKSILEEVEIPEVDKKLQTDVKKRLQKVSDLLEKPKPRYIWELKNAKEAENEILKRIKEKEEIEA